MEPEILKLDENGVRKTFSASVKSYDDTNLTIEHFISTEDVDRSRDRVFANGMKMDGVPAVLKQHGMDLDTGYEPIAKAVSIKPDSHSGKKGIVAKTQFYDGSHYGDNTGRRLYEKARDGFMDKWSIGFDIIKATPNKEGGRDIQEWILYEYSQVGVPDNIYTGQLKSKSHYDEPKKSNDIVKFVLKKDEDKETFDCECIECGYKEKADKHCSDITCSKCGGQMRREERPGPGKNAAPDESGGTVLDMLKAGDVEGIAICDPTDQKPYENYHACRLHDPDKYSETRYAKNEREHDGRKYDVLYGKRKSDGEWEDQSYRYKKSLWSEEDASAHCKEKKGTFEASKSVLAPEKKVLRESMRGQIQLNALFQIFDSYLGELFTNATSEKEVRSLVKELSELVLQYSLEYLSEFASDMDKDARVETYKELKQIASFVKSADEPAPDDGSGGSGGDDEPPPAQEKKGMFRLVERPKKPTMKCSGAVTPEALVKLVQKSMQDTAKDCIRQISGKLD